MSKPMPKRILLPSLILVVLPWLGCGEPDRGSKGSGERPHASDTNFSRLLIDRAKDRFRSGGMPQEPPLEAVRLGSELLTQGQYDAAAAALEPVVRDFPDSGRAKFLFALAHHKAKRYAQARGYFEELLERGPRFDKAEWVFYFYGWGLYYLGEPDVARDAFEAFLTFQPDDYDAHFALGLISLANQDLDRAKEQFEQASAALDKLVKGDPRQGPRKVADFAKIQTGLGDVAGELDDLAQARGHYEMCVNAYPPAYETWFKLSRIYTRLQETELAANALKEHDRWKKNATQNKSEGQSP